MSSTYHIKLVLFKNKTLELSDYFHHLHHKHFELNYGNIYAPLDNFFKSFHNGKIPPSLGVSGKLFNDDFIVAVGSLYLGIFAYELVFKKLVQFV